MIFHIYYVKTTTLEELELYQPQHEEICWLLNLESECKGVNQIVIIRRQPLTAEDAVSIMAGITVNATL